jgi:predicted pyridoxine 5'-phosphate oxidase superfamily flavin-nucleotide-binding protein
MTNQGLEAAVGFHAGELEVQRQAGVQREAARLSPMVARGELRAGIAAFLADVSFGALTARDRTGRLWVSPLVGPPGLMTATSPTTLSIEGALPDVDPLYGLPDGQRVGLIAIDFATRRRVRINGILAAVNGNGLTVGVEQAYGNCPQYIHCRSLRVGGSRADATPSRTYSGDVLRHADIQLVHAAQTFFLGTTHPDFGNDASHRGGPTGFVHATPNHLWWPDYPGNNMFNSFGNLAVDPTAALLFIDFSARTALQLSGTAAVRWNAPAASSEHTETGRCVDFTPQKVLTTTVPRLHLGLAREDAD